MKLTAKQKKFADNYIKTGNATQSAIDAGYSKKTAPTIASENLIKPNIKAYIDKKMREIESDRIMDAQEALEFLTNVVRGKELETKVVTTQYDVSTVKVPADVKTKISAAKEILKRYPDNDKLLEQQIRKITAEADIAEARAKELEPESGADDNDGFIRALKNSARNVWGDDNEA
ncbi:terminase small subunit [Pediococcus acidilactici]|uniref:Terminase small subunit n=1 Tax=Pediococcus acidilactici TaxID=1254 RepID=A0AAN1ASE1_PEDAC|nr:terminase small subunit [Pediococcus acidilactici]GAC46154.1 phage terminase small subunit [Pediococcus acidilactici NGRI 0510Q]APR28065.1 terminase small subunit [Pediococcus acidilactici]APR28116.1 terminase small subunit [Pediococcus acidilactici]KRN89923.1 phage terminase small subunit [Pediococcus acidilactici]MCQ0050362.1 terminase small subunit [Pediococcus acidilactici]